MNSADDQRRVEEIFLTLLDLPPANRAAALDDLCSGNQQLKGEVLSLLKFHDSGGGMLDNAAPPFPGVLDAATDLADAAGDETSLPLNPRAGGYELHEMIGSGGMGVVYRAVQQRTLRTVALKLIRPSIATPVMQRRFEVEAAMLARLHHPGIAQIFEADIADFGNGPQPFIAMEFIHGEPLTTYAANRRLSVPLRIELMARVCDALQHAHQRGVIHRDLKPGNILVVDQEFSESPASGTHLPGLTAQPKILDFGVARAADADTATATLHTSPGQLIGTLSYMSPEQLTGDPAAIDTRSDVYALGVVLYELLTGRLPHELSNLPLVEAARVVRYEPHRRASTFDRSLRGDLDVILDKALEKDKERRYQSAADLAADLRRHLNHEPLIARPASTMYQLGKFVRRHKAAVGSAAAVLVAILLGLAGTTRGMIVAQRNAEEAQRQTRIAQSVNAFLNDDLLARIDPFNEPDRDITLRDAIGHSAQRIDERFDDVPEVAAALHLTVGKAYRGLGMLEEAQTHLRRALEASRQAHGESHDAVAEALNQLAQTHWNAGEYDVAESTYRQALEMIQLLHGLDHVQTTDSLSGLGLVLQSKGLYNEAEQYMRRSLGLRLAAHGDEHFETATTKNSLAGLLADMGRHDEAEQLYQEALSTFRKLNGDDHYLTLHVTNNLAVLMTQQGRLAEAEPLYRKALASLRKQLGEEHATVGVCMANIADVLRRQENFVDAEARYRAALNILRNALGDDHAFTMTVLNNLGEVLIKLGRIDEAEPLIAEALERRLRILGPDHPDTLISIVDRGWLNEVRGRFADAVRDYALVLETRQRVLGMEHFATIHVKTQLARALRNAGDYPGAEAQYREVLQLRRALLGDDHRDTQSAMIALAECLNDQSRLDEAQSLFEDVLATRRRMLPADHPDVAAAAYALGSNSLERGHPAEAEPLLREALEIRRVAFGKESVRTAVVEIALGDCLTRLKQYDEAEALLTHALAIVEREPAHAQVDQIKKQLILLYKQWGRPERIGSLHPATTPTTPP